MSLWLQHKGQGKENDGKMMTGHNHRTGDNYFRKRKSIRKVSRLSEIKCKKVKIPIIICD